MVALADDEFSPSSYILLQRPLAPTEPSEQNAAQEDAYIEVNSQRHSGYGGILCATLSEGKLSLTLSPESAHRMSVDETIEIAFCVTPSQHREMAEQLRYILGDDIVSLGRLN